MRPCPFFRVLDDKFFCRSAVEVIGDLGLERRLVALEGELESALC
jgi:hypothetical protein